MKCVYCRKELVDPHKYNHIATVVTVNSKKFPPSLSDAILATTAVIICDDPECKVRLKRMNQIILPFLREYEEKHKNENP